MLFREASLIWMMFTPSCRPPLPWLLKLGPCVLNSAGTRSSTAAGFFRLTWPIGVAMRPRTSRGVFGLKSRPNGVSPSGRGWGVRRGCPRNHLWFALSSIRAAEFCTCAWRPPRPAQLKTAGASSSREMITPRSEEHTSELQSLAYLVCRLLLEKKKKNTMKYLSDEGGMDAVSTRKISLNDCYSNVQCPQAYTPHSSVATQSDITLVSTDATTHRVAI